MRWKLVKTTTDAQNFNLIGSFDTVFLKIMLVLIKTVLENEITKIGLPDSEPSLEY